MKIIAGIVTYNPDLYRLNNNLEHVKKQVDSIIVVDNNSTNIDDIIKLLNTYNNITLIMNNINLGVAKALSQIMDYSIANNYDWTLTLDQDSVCLDNIINVYEKYVNLDKVAILTCNIQDRNFFEETGFCQNQSYREIKQCITAASFVNVSAYRNIKGFDEKLFIDSVDFDICIKFRQKGYKIYKINFDGILHEVGHGRNIKLLGKRYILYNHSAFRHYYMARNHFYLVNKYPSEFRKWKEILREIRTEFLLCFESQSFQKIFKRWRGLIDVHKLIGKDKLDE